jgi:SH3 domain-containing YSC84-like protein 1
MERAGHWYPTPAVMPRRVLAIHRSDKRQARIKEKSCGRLLFSVALVATALYGQEETPDHRLKTASAVVHEIMSAPDKGIPKDLLAKAQCVVIVPGLKDAAFFVGGEYGRGFALCRTHGAWGAPAAVRFSGGSFGAQIGGKSTDVVMLVMSRRGMERLATDKFTIGGDVSAAAGPIGRTASAEMDLQLYAEILSCSRTRGAFAGVALDGTVVNKDDGEDRKLYGREVNNKVVLEGAVHPPEVAARLVSELDRYSQPK